VRFREGWPSLSDDVILAAVIQQKAGGWRSGNAGCGEAADKRRDNVGSGRCLSTAGSWQAWNSEAGLAEVESHDVELRSEGCERRTGAAMWERQTSMSHTGLVSHTHGDTKKRRAGVAFGQTDQVTKPRTRTMESAIDHGALGDDDQDSRWTPSTQGQCRGQGVEHSQSGSGASLDPGPVRGLVNKGS
jgi:hypothetical protein